LYGYLQASSGFYLTDGLNQHERKGAIPIGGGNFPYWPQKSYHAPSEGFLSRCPQRKALR